MTGVEGREPAQVTGEELAGMSPQEVVAALSEGRLAALLALPAGPLDGMSPEEIVAAREAGRLDAYLRGDQPGPAA